MEPTRAERLFQIRKDREEQYAKNYQRKQRVLYIRKCEEAHRQLHIGNPKLRAAIKLDVEAAKTEKNVQFQPVVKQMRERERLQMEKEDNIRWRPSE